MSRPFGRVASVPLRATRRRAFEAGWHGCEESFLSEVKKFHIYDQDYDLRTNSEEGVVRLGRVSDLVDRKMRDVASRYVNLNAKQIAVLAALNLADEYIDMQERLFSEQVSVGEEYADCATCLPAYIEKIESFLEAKGR